MKREFLATDLAALFQGTLVGLDVKVSGFATDSRACGPSDLFIAIRGERVDGRDFLSSVSAACALVEPGHPLADKPQLPVIVVPNIVEALASFGRSLRAQFHGPVVGVTGSVGKSTVKEMIATALSPLGEVVKTEGNRNTEYTAPLLWASVGSDTAAAVVEMGMRGSGQIAHLASIAQPTIGVITNVGVTHLSELGSREAIARAKAELFEGLAGEQPIAIFPADDPWADLLRDAAGNARVWTFGTDEIPEPDARITSYSATDWTSSRAEINVSGEEINVTLPVVGRHFALGAAAALLVARAAGVPLADAARALSRVQLPPMRMAVREHEGITWVLDMYNAAPASTVAALETLAEVAAGPRYAVLGEMRELGDACEEGHREVGSALAKLGFAGAITLDAGAPEVGAQTSPTHTRLAGPTRWIVEAAIEGGMPASNLVHAASFEEVREWLSQRSTGDTILVKGSRGVELERVVPEGLATS